jgi:hypothetical protein
MSFLKCRKFEKQPCYYFLNPCSVSELGGKLVVAFGFFFHEVY